MTDPKQHDALGQALRRVREDDEALRAPPAVEARLLDEVRRLQKPERGWSPQLIAALVAASIVIATISITLWKLRKPEPSAVVAQEVTTEFFPLFYASVPTVQSHVVRIELPRASLARFGLMSADGIDRATGTVLADVLVGDDGLARAVRFVRKVSREQRQ